MLDPLQPLDFSDTLASPPFAGQFFEVWLDEDAPIDALVSLEVHTYCFNPELPDEDLDFRYTQRIDTMCIPVGLPEPCPKGGFGRFHEGIPDAPTICDMDPLAHNGDEIVLTSCEEDMGDPLRRHKWFLRILSEDLSPLAEISDPHPNYGRKVIGPVAISDFYDGPGHLPDGQRDVILVSTPSLGFGFSRLYRITNSNNVLTVSGFRDLEELGLDALTHPTIADVDPNLPGPEILITCRNETSDNLCVCVFAPDLELLSRADLGVLYWEPSPSTDHALVGGIAAEDAGADGIFEAFTSVAYGPSTVHTFALQWTTGGFEAVHSAVLGGQPMPANVEPVVGFGNAGEFPNPRLTLSLRGRRQSPEPDNPWLVSWPINPADLSFGTSFDRTTAGIQNRHGETVLARLNSLGNGTANGLNPIVDDLLLHEFRAFTVPPDESTPLWSVPYYRDNSQAVLQRSSVVTSGCSGMYTGTRAAVCPTFNDLSCLDCADSAFFTAVDAWGNVLPGFPTRIGVWDSMVVSPAIGDLSGDEDADAVVIYRGGCVNGDTYGVFVKTLSTSPNEPYQPSWGQYRHDCERKASMGSARIGGNLSAGSHTWQGEIWVDGDVIIPVNSQLTLLPGTRVYMVGDAAISVYGTFNAPGLESDSISFVGVYSPDQPWSGIYAYSGSTIKLDYCVIEGANTGVTFHGCALASIEKSRVSNCTDGVHFRNCCTDLVQARDCLLTGNKRGITASNSNGLIIGNEISNNTYMGVLWQ
jgi:hypothetical protein